MKALSIRSPWWWFILHAGKNIENRDWPTNFRGTILIQASKRWQYQEITDDIQAALECCGNRRKEVAAKLTYEALQAACGCIVGQVDIVDCVPRSDSKWFFGDYGFVLANPIAFPAPIPCRGSLGLFEVPTAVLKQLEWDL